MACEAEAPKPKRPTRSPGCVPATRRLRKPMMPAQRSGATWVLSRVAGSGIDEVGADEGVLGVASVDGVAGEGGVVAEVFFVADAEGAGAVGAADPGDADAGVCGEFGGGAFDDFADDLMAEDEGLVDEGEVAFEDVEVGAADSAGEDAEEDVVGGEGGRGTSSIWRGWLAVWRMAAFIWVAPSGKA